MILQLTLINNTVNKTHNKSKLGNYFIDVLRLFIFCKHIIYTVHLCRLPYLKKKLKIKIVVAKKMRIIQDLKLEKIYNIT
jgi:hypothetical protein